MKQQNSHIAKSVVLLVVFLFLKLGIVHAMEHAFSIDDFNDCEECVVVVETNKTNPFNVGSVSFDINEPKIDFSKTTNLIYVAPNVGANEYLSFFNKPPPFL